ncbi:MULTISPECIES: hypothetical protein [Kocuria]|uniref:hypothetical protein n=1 Tax=Kocuria TaxID=57493 RepID=UPI001F2B46F6|nr:hypothetical protein [Kocuria soli]
MSSPRSTTFAGPRRSADHPMIGEAAYMPAMCKEIVNPISAIVSGLPAEAPA